MKIAIGGDHAGFEYKEVLIEMLKADGHEVKDFGPYNLDSVDYPDFVHPVANAINNKEFEMGKNINLNMMEWTIDQERIYENPLMTEEGQYRIRNLCAKFNFSIPSLTGDCFMQSPFWKSKNNERKSLVKVFLDVVNSCSAVNIEMIVVP